VVKKGGDLSMPETLGGLPQIRKHKITKGGGKGAGCGLLQEPRDEAPTGTVTTVGLASKSGEGARETATS